MPTSKYLLILDPGHGGSDPGAVDGGMREKDLTLRLASLVDQRAKGQGIQTILTRTSDVFVSLGLRAAKERNAVASFAGQTAFISLHINASGAGSMARGLSVFYHEVSERGHALAKSIFGMMAGRVGSPIPPFADGMPVYNAGVLADEGDGILNDESFLEHALYVLKHTTSPAVLVELGFITNAADRTLLSDGRFLDRAALGIVDGVKAWFAA